MRVVYFPSGTNYQIDNDGSIIDADGKILFFSLERFVNDIGKGDCCFICGKARSAGDFNDEHVMPEWVLRKYNLFSGTIGLKNEAKIRYDRYKVPCCIDCNSLMGRELEDPMSRIVAGGHEAVANHVTQNGAMLLFVWMAVIFIKAHLKDKELRYERDLRKESGSISDGLYTWEELHHVHCVARLFYTNNRFSSNSFGSFLLFPAKSELVPDHFDFVDLTHFQSMMIRMDDIALFAVFNDSCGAINGFMPMSDRIQGPLSQLQLREVLSHLSFLNYSLKIRPRHSTRINSDGSIEIVSEVPTNFELVEELDYGIFGALMWELLKDQLSKLQARNMSQTDFHDRVRAGQWTFLFDENQNFIHHAISPKTKGDA